jgi:hypothetical protein
VKNLLIFLSLFASLYSAEFDYKTNISLQNVIYNSYTNEKNILGDIKLDAKTKHFDIKTTIEYLYSDNYKQKRYIDIYELYISKEFDDSKIEMGKTTKFWGELEGYNVTDIFNQKNYLFDPFDKNKKLGSYNINYTYYFDENSLEAGVKLYEDDLKLPDASSPYSITNIQYDKNLQSENSKTNPSIYIKYNFLLGDIFQSDNKLVLWHGYDNKRYFIPLGSTIAQYAYKVNKALFFSNIVYEDYIFKIECSYTDVLDDKRVSTYSQSGIGFERGFYDIYGSDAYLYMEYYRYHYKDDAKIKLVDMAEGYDNDIFTAIKINLNNTDASELKSGVLYDVKNYERVFKTEFKTRVIDSFVLKLEHLQYKKNDRFVFNITYTF